MCYLCGGLFLACVQPIIKLLNRAYIGYTPATKGKFNLFLNVAKYSNKNALMTFAFGDYSLTTESMTDTEVTNTIMEHLKSIYGKNIPSPTDMLRTKWNSNKNTYGSYSYVKVGNTSKAYYAMEEPIENRIYFAGEHTSFDYRATVHGAYGSGIKAAKKVRNQFK